VDRKQHLPNKRPPPHPRAQNAPELKVAGRNACRALYEKRPQDIRRVYLTEENIPFFADALKYCARERIAYHIKTDADLDVVAETVHHDGVLFLAREKPQRSFDDVVKELAAPGPASLVLLEDVKNPHNLGAILRVCAHFGVRAVLAAGQTPALSPAAMRTAEGGAEHVDVVPVGDGVDALRALRDRGFRVVATSSHTQGALDVVDLPPRSVVLFGSEGEGLSKRLLDEADLRVQIPGSGALESLNVACASSVILWELWRRRGGTERRAAGHAQAQAQAQVRKPTHQPRPGKQPHKSNRPRR
jgi:TrmH RNA methyltransferase